MSIFYNRGSFFTAVTMAVCYHWFSTSMCFMRKEIYAVGSCIDLMEESWLKDKKRFKGLAEGRPVGSSGEFSGEK